MHVVSVILHGTVVMYVTRRHSQWTCKLSPYSCRPRAHGLCESAGSDYTQQLCKGLSVSFMLFTAMGSQRDPESHWHRSTVFPSLTCSFNPHNASLVRLYGRNPEPIDLSGKLPTDSTGLLITAFTCDVNFTFKFCANLPGLWLA